MKNIFQTVMFLSLFIGIPVDAQDSDYMLHKAIELFGEGEVEKSLEQVDRCLGQNPESADAYVLKCRISFSKGKYGSALSDINKAIEYGGRKDMTYKYTKYWWRAKIYSELEQYDKALSDLDIACKAAGKVDKSALNGILGDKGHIYYILKEYDLSDRMYEDMLRNDETNQMAMVGMARNMLETGQYESAVRLLDECEKYDSDYEEIFRFRMEAYDKIGETDKAIDDAVSYFSKTDNPQSDILLDILGRHRSYAIAKIDTEISDADNKFMWIALKAMVYENCRDYRNAIVMYDLLEQEYGSDPSVYLYKSICYGELGEFDRAICEISRCIDMVDDDYVKYAYRADFYRENGMYEDAVSDFTKVIERNPLMAYGYYKRGLCYEQSGDDGKAMDDYNAGIDIDKTFPYIYLMRGEMYLKYGHKKQADADFREIIKLDTLADVGSCRQYALHFLGNDDAALEWMERIIAYDPDNAGSYYDKACLMSRMGRTDEAINALHSAFEKGYRSFAHIEHDDDMDSIRNLPEFISLIAEYESETEQSVFFQEPGPEDRAEPVVSEIPMTKMYGGVYEVPCNINGLALDFILDTGAGSVSISSVEATFMLKNGYLNEKDIKGINYYSTATGEIREGTVINLPEVIVGEAVLHNVEASVAHNQKAPLLLGQSVLERFGVITIDNINSKLIIKQ